MARLERLMGKELQERDLNFIRRDLPVTELELLKEYSSIDSASLNKTGVTVMQDKVAAYLAGLGFHLKTLSGEDRFSHLVIAEKPGKSSDKFITLITHSDTVLGNYREFSIEPADDRAFGSGVIDNKGGLVVGLTALKRFLDQTPDTAYGLRFVCSPNEEVGSIGFTEVFRELGPDTVVAFGLEPALDNGSIIHQRRGNRWYDVEIKGKEAHAGRSYGHHANAAHDLARKIVSLAEITNYRKHVSVSVGAVRGGRDKHNIICGDASMKLDVRFPSMEARESTHRRIEKILGEPSERSVDGKFETVTSYRIVDDCPPFSLTRRSKAMARELAALISHLEGRKVFSQPAGGAGDVNYLSTPTNFVLDGLGPVGGEMHTHHEFVSVASLKTRSQALAGFLHYLQNQKLER
jgi:glutamate carboxypeptidase